MQINLWFIHIHGIEMHPGARFLLGEFAIYSQSLLIDAYVTSRGSHGLGYGHMYVRYLLCTCQYISANLSSSLPGILPGKSTWKILLQNSTENRKVRKIKSQRNSLLLWNIFLLPSRTYSLFYWAALTQCLILFHNFTSCKVVTQLQLRHANFRF